MLSYLKTFVKAKEEPKEESDIENPSSYPKKIYKRDKHIVSLLSSTNPEKKYNDYLNTLNKKYEQNEVEFIINNFKQDNPEYKKIIDNFKGKSTTTSSSSSTTTTKPTTSTSTSVFNTNEIEGYKKKKDENTIKTKNKRMIGFLRDEKSIEYKKIEKALIRKLNVENPEYEYNLYVSKLIDEYGPKDTNKLLTKFFNDEENVDYKIIRDTFGNPDSSSTTQLIKSLNKNVKDDEDKKLENTVLYKLINNDTLSQNKISNEFLVKKLQNNYLDNKINEEEYNSLYNKLKTNPNLIETVDVKKKKIIIVPPLKKKKI